MPPTFFRPPSGVANDGADGSDSDYSKGAAAFLDDPPGGSANRLIRLLLPELACHTPRVNSCSRATTDGAPVRARRRRRSAEERVRLLSTVRSRSRYSQSTGCVAFHRKGNPAIESSSVPPLALEDQN